MMHPVLDLANPFQSSPEPPLSSLNSGESEPSVTPAYGAGEPVAEPSLEPPSGMAPATGQIPAGYVLVERELLGRLLKRVQQIQARDREALRERLPSFLTANHLERA